MDKLRAIVSDANVLIDIIKADIEVLRKAAEVYEIHIPYVVLLEVEQLSEGKAESLGLRIYEEDRELIQSAISGQGSLSMQDLVCLEIARKEGFACLTNDKNLHKKCNTEKIPCIWGFGLILNLVSAKKISKARAKTTAQKIKESNVFIKQDVLNDFFEKLENIR